MNPETKKPKELLRELWPTICMLIGICAGVGLTLVLLSM